MYCQRGVQLEKGGVSEGTSFSSSVSFPSGPRFPAGRRSFLRHRSVSFARFPRSGPRLLGTAAHVASHVGATGVCEKTLLLYEHWPSSSRNCSPASDLELFKLIFPRVLFSRGVSFSAHPVELIYKTCMISPYVLSGLSNLYCI